MAAVDIILPTYNGAKYLGEQIDSITAQPFTDWHLIVRDDGSHDGTQEVVERYRRTLGEKMTVLTDFEGTLGHAQSFARLLAHSSAPYVTLCDQDDVWLPDKLERSLDDLQRLERSNPQRTPAVVFSDTVVVDDVLTTTERSFLAAKGLDPRDAEQLGKIVDHNVISAHAMTINSAMRDVVLPLPTDIDLIDWWIALLAAAIGAVTYLPEPTTLYRQHASNAVGAQSARAGHPKRALVSLRTTHLRRQANEYRLFQVAHLAERVTGRIDPSGADVLDTFLRLPRMGLFWRMRAARRHGLLPRGVVRSARFVWYVQGWLPPRDSSYRSHDKAAT